MVREGVVYLNEILDEMKLHPPPQQRDMSKRLRQIGLGLMGADMLSNYRTDRQSSN